MLTSPLRGITLNKAPERIVGSTIDRSIYPSKNGRITFVTLVIPLKIEMYSYFYSFQTTISNNRFRKYLLHT